MSKYKISHGFSFTNKQFIKKLEKLSKKGWHFKKNLFIISIFERGEPKNYKYELIYDKKFDKERIEFYRSGGWEVLRNSFFWQILRGEEDASELYTDSLSKVEMWKFRIKFTGILSLICVFISLLAFILSSYIFKGSEVLDFIQGMFFGYMLGLMALNVFFYVMYHLERRKEDN